MQEKTLDGNARERAKTSPEPERMDANERERERERNVCVRENEHNMKGRRDNVTHFETVVHTTTKMRFNGM